MNGPAKEMPDFYTGKNKEAIDESMKKASEWLTKQKEINEPAKEMPDFYTKTKKQTLADKLITSMSNNANKTVL